MAAQNNKSVIETKSFLLSINDSMDFTLGILTTNTPKATTSAKRLVVNGPANGSSVIKQNSTINLYKKRIAFPTNCILIHSFDFVVKSNNSGE